MYNVIFTRQAAKDAKKLKAAGLDGKAKQLISLVKQDPFAYPPAFEPLIGSLEGMYSRRINRQHRFVYEVIKSVDSINEAASADNQKHEGIVKVLSMWTHYETM